MSTDTAPITRFLARVRQATQLGARDLRLTLPEATELAASIGQVLAGALSAPAPSATPSPQTGKSHGVYQGPVGHQVTVMDGGKLNRRGA